MKREIKFRCFHKGKMITDVTVYDGAVIDSAFRTYDTPNMEFERLHGAIPMQFTGLTDKNGVEWFEGDIVRGQYGKQMSDESVDQIGVIEFWRGRFQIRFPVKTVCLSDTNLDATCYWASTVKWPTERTQGYQITGLEIIGNRFENPELLEAN